ncbi:MAG: PfaD family polyunsaturated fatty acid/polyketide biosynthesis protein [Geminicoccaceae bacterium]
MIDAIRMINIEIPSPDELDRVLATPRAIVDLSVNADGVVSILGETCPPPAEGGHRYRLPPIFPEWLGDRRFNATHHVRFPYVVGEMARGIATPRLVVAAAKAGLLGFYGSAGLGLSEIRSGVEEIKKALDPENGSWGANLIHAPHRPGDEGRVVDLFLELGVRRVSASAFMRLTPDLVRYVASGLQHRSDGSVIRGNHLIPKISRAELAEQFMAPPPASVLQGLVAGGRLSPEQADLAARVPVAEDITAEADSGGHTDNRPAAVLLHSLSMARDRIASRHGIDANGIRIGLAGGIGTPSAVAAAFQMGAAYVLTGSINQAAVESGLSTAGRSMLAEAAPTDVMMAPAADMFEQGVRVQVLKRSTMFPMRAEKLYRLYRSGAAYEELSQGDREWLDDLLGESFESAWAATERHLQPIDPSVVERAKHDGNKKLALVSRRYLFLGAQWAREGQSDRRLDFQIWCGPAMGAFNEWVSGTSLQPIDNRTVKQISWNLLEGAAVLTRAAQMRAAGVAIPPNRFTFKPRLFE